MFHMRLYICKAAGAQLLRRSHSCVCRWYEIAFAKQDKSNLRGERAKGRAVKTSGGRYSIRIRVDAVTTATAATVVVTKRKKQQEA